MRNTFTNSGDISPHAQQWLLHYHLSAIKFSPHTLIPSTCTRFYPSFKKKTKTQQNDWCSCFFLPTTEVCLHPSTSFPGRSLSGPSSFRCQKCVFLTSIFKSLLGWFTPSIQFAVTSSCFSLPFYIIFLCPSLLYSGNSDLSVYSCLQK